jgi:diguanylate cyclase (GGDEF)-like protein
MKKTDKTQPKQCRGQKKPKVQPEKTKQSDDKIIASNIRGITERKRAEEALSHLNTHDALTGLYNSGFFEEEMARLERGWEFPVSIMMADLDYLKDTNDQDGHAARDALLKCVAQALNGAFRAEDVVARIGGDEFAVLLPATDATAAEISLQRVRQVIQENNAAHTGTPIRLSLGVSTAENPAPFSGVLKGADANMYREKRGHDAS